MKTENYGEADDSSVKTKKPNGKKLTIVNQPQEVVFQPEDFEDDDQVSSPNEAHHLMEIGRSGRYLITRDTPSATSSPVIGNNGNHLNSGSGEQDASGTRRPSTTKSLKSVSSAGGRHGGGSLRGGSSTPEDIGSRQ